MPALATWSPLDPLLGVVAPLALAASVRTALVIDLDPDGVTMPAAATLADLVARGPRSAELSPQRSGTAVLANGGLAAEDGSDVVAALVAGWPHVVIRTGSEGWGPVPRVPVLPLLPAELVEDYGAAVYQRVAWSGPTPGDGVTLPRPSPSSVRALLEMRRPFRGPWLRAWARVWRRSWA